MLDITYAYSCRGVINQAVQRIKLVSRWVAIHQQGKAVSDQQSSSRPLKAHADAQEYVYMAAQLPECSSAADVAAKAQQAKGSETEPQQHHKAPEEERAAAPHSKGGANADCQSEASQSHIC